MKFSTEQLRAFNEVITTCMEGRNSFTVMTISATVEYPEYIMIETLDGTRFKIFDSGHIAVTWVDE